MAAVFQIFDAANIVARCILRGAGDVRYAAVVGVLTSWLCTPTFAWIFGHRLGLGALGGWLGLCLEIVLASAVLWIRLERRRWLGIAMASRARILSEPVSAKGYAAVAQPTQATELDPSSALSTR